MAEIVQAKVAKPGGAAMADKRFRYTVRLPCGDTAVVVNRYVSGVGGTESDR